MPKSTVFLVVLMVCSAGYVQSRTRGIYPVITGTRHLCGFCKRFIPVHENPVTYVRGSYPCPKFL